jgi:hypothetical protein
MGYWLFGSIRADLKAKVLCNRLECMVVITGVCLCLIELRYLSVETGCGPAAVLHMIARRQLSFLEE